ncbi:hypothetical protein QAD02_016480 [Eretmocerus hayati]|uniref:Uncharacterized protein n=1 Tax=Eretmocerus hayati TaxID=131215 RepID=A0ACC2PB78_9HYME|nr:hypothetical protein QAD02_016480 [Eretmocerus hayati]
MARRGRKSSRYTSSQPCTSAQADEDDSMDDEPRSSTQPQESQDDPFEQQQQADRVAHLVKYLLGACHSNQSASRQLASKALGFNTKQFRSALAGAHVVFGDVFGYNLVESDNKLMLCNTLTNDNFEYSDEICGRYAILFLVLSHIYMSGQKCGEASLMNFLTTLGVIDGDNAVHETLGNITRLVTEEFVKERYIEKEKSENNEISEVEYKWGKRADQELTPRAVMEFVSKVYGNKDLQSWQQQYDCMLRKERSSVTV